ncbi:hypothetical protein NAT51_07270 [Flavobacterium amniphilum]|uniref:hypothetical protein n=1 Tax=Flavobacterium amniphilum TaxID=1834035 RepID=UPI00202A2FE0|nr:hypothetical protein [Flavobacterium amniphilum]MCL9805315.1 hypothetical protein [Flavobacterium amniphilum]
MLLNNNTTKETKSASLYEVEDTITFQLGESNYTSKASYQLHIGKSREYNNQIVLNRANFKIDGKEPEKKFPKISSRYFSSIFPLVLTYHEGNYTVAEYKEAAKRIMENDLVLKNDYSGDGFEYIREQFLNRVKNQSEFQKFIELLPVYQILNMSAAPKFKKEQISFKWNIAGMDVVDGIADFKLDTVESKMKVSLKNTNEGFIMEMIEKYITENGILMSFSENEFPEISFNAETFYNDTLNEIKYSNAEFKISFGGKFKYKQNFYLTLSPTNN